MSNLTFQFESKDKEAMSSDLSNLEQFQQQQQPLTGKGATKPPLPQEAKAVSTGFDTCILCLPGEDETTPIEEEDAKEVEKEATAMKQQSSQQQLQHPQDMTFVFQSLSTRSEYSNRILKRTLSCDHILDICQVKSSNLHHSSTAATDEFSLKKCKKSFAEQRRQLLAVPAAASSSDASTTDCHLNKHPAPLFRTLSLPNISLNSLSLKKRINLNYSTMMFRQRTTYLRSEPLDLHYIRAQISKQIQAAAEGGDGAAGSFVKRRTEELEGKSQQDLHQQPTFASVKLNKSKSMPSSPNFHFITASAITNSEKSDIQSSTFSTGKGTRALQHSNSAKSFDFPVQKCSLESAAAAEESQIGLSSCGKKSHKKTYGRSHPLDKLHKRNKWHLHTLGSCLVQPSPSQPPC